MKIKVLVLTLALSAALLAGCSKAAPEAPEAPAAPAEEQAEVVTTASIVNEEAAFLNAISKDGTWIIATLNDLTIDKELVLEGEFYNKDDKEKGLYRKLGLYAQDADKNVTARYSLTAPKLTIKSENAKIQSGTFVGDVYVEANGFTLSDAKVEGNVYFASEEFKASFVSEKESTVTGATEVK